MSTPLLGLALPPDGTTNWGTLVNTSITALLDSAVAGTTTLAADSDVTLTNTAEVSNQARQAILLCSGARTALRTVTAPAQSKIYIVINNTSGGYGVKLVGAGPTTGVTVPAGKVYMLAWNGSDFVTIGVTTVNLATDVTGALGVSNGGTGQSTYTNGQLLIGNSTGNTLTKATLATSGTGLSVTNGAGSITLQNTAPDQVVILTGGGATTVSGTYPSFTISSVNTTYSTATDSVNGLIKLGNATVQSTAANAVTTDASRTYAIQLNASGQAVVNVPWSAASANPPGGSNTQVQYNNAGAFGGSANFTFDGQRVTVYGLTVSSAVFRSSDASIVSASTITPPSDSVNQYNVTALAVPATIAAPSGTPVNGQKLLIRLKDDGTARALTWDAAYSEVGAVLPTTTVATKITYVGCVYNSADAVWDVVAVTTQA